VFAEIIEKFLIRQAIWRSYNDPEDLAHDIVIAALEGRINIKYGRAQRYLSRAVLNNIINRRQKDRFIHYTDKDVDGDKNIPLAPQYSYKEDSYIDAKLTLSELISTELPSIRLLLDYIESNEVHSVTSRIKTMRLRKRLRTVCDY